jgi:hypothetical protein
MSHIFAGTDDLNMTTATKNFDELPLDAYWIELFGDPTPTAQVILDGFINNNVVVWK